MNKTITALRFDMDDTLVALLPTWVAELNNRYNLNVDHMNIVEWNMQKAFPSLSMHQITEVLFEEDFWKKVPPLPYAQEYLKRFINEGYDVKICTASHYRSLPFKLEQCLFKHFPFLDYKDVIVAYDKGAIKGDALVDDYQYNLMDFDGYRFLINMSHNQRAEITSYDFRANNLKEVYQIIKELSNNER